MSATKDTAVRIYRWFDSKVSEEVFNWRVANGYPPHVRPFSTMIAAIGNHWHPDCFEAVHEMAKQTYEQGYDVCFYEEHDRCYQPYDALGIMRNLAYMKAITQGYEFLLYVDNDVKPDPKVLVNLLHRFVPIVSPIIDYWDGNDYDQGLPRMEKNRGLALIGSIPLSMVLFQTRVFMPWVVQPFWQDAIGADESYHFQKLEAAGHRPFVDTDETVIAVSAPHYPLDEVQNHKEKTTNNVGLYVPSSFAPRGKGNLRTPQRGEI